VGSDWTEPMLWEYFIAPAFAFASSLKLPAAEAKRVLQDPEG